MMKLIWLFSFWMTAALADSVDIRVEPQEPLVNENYQVIFEVTTEEGTDPVINFNPLNAEVVAKSETGIRTRTTYVNGKLSTERTLTVVYEMNSARAGSAYLRNIKVDLNGNTLNPPTKRINILKTAKKPREVLVRAEVDKEEAFVGESIVVRYYLYNRVPVTSNEIRKFPKLDDFLKRYHQEKMNPQRVRLNGEIYTRRVIYTAQLFASKKGTHEIDPIALTVRYSARGGNNPFDSFGFGSRYGRSKKANITSPPVEIRIKALPVENVPPSFTGLVGKHDFKLELSKNRFVVNEPIELKLRVSGEGALELYEAPKIFTHPAIEEFETSADLNVKENFTAAKSFLYTYLGREEASIKDKEIPFSYFDPETLRYVTEYAKIGDILIAGGVPSAKKGEGKASPGPDSSGKEQSAELKRYFEPVYKLAGTYTYNAVYISVGLMLLLFLVFAKKNYKMLANMRAQKPSIVKKVAKEGLDYSNLHLLVTKLGAGADMRQRVQNSDISEKAKKFLLETIDRRENEYKSGKKLSNTRVPKSLLREFAKKLGSNG